MGARGGGVVLALAGLALAACGGSSSRSADLLRDVRGYGNGLRWRDFPAAALRVAPARRDAFLEQREQLDEDLRIADWELTRLSYDDSGHRAQVHVEYTWLLDSRGVVHTTVTRQWWTRHGDRWLIDREVRVRGEPMPGLAEPARRSPRRAPGPPPTRPRRAQ
jgi:hypothetical protein